MEPTRRSPEAVTPRLGLWDATSIIVGIIIGVGIFKLPATIFASAPGPWEAIGVWALGGVLVLIGALCFAELASTYPRSGGEYVYLTRAFGSGAGFLFAWAQLAIIRPGSIGGLAYVFAEYACLAGGISNVWTVPLAFGAVAILTVINTLGVTLGTTTQNILTVIKLIGLAGIVVIGIGWGHWQAPTGSEAPVAFSWFPMAMIFVLWTYAGWHEAAYIAAEVKKGRRNIPLALLLGTVTITVIYLLVNVAYLMGVGWTGAQRSDAAAGVVSLVWPGLGSSVINVLIMISALGATNGMIFTTARIYSEFGADHRLFRPLSRWNPKLGTPVTALVMQSLVSGAMILAVGVFGEGGKWLDAMIELTAAVFWGFFFVTGLALFVLRRKDADLPRSFHVPLYPVLPLVFCGWCAFMVFGSFQAEPAKSLIGLGLLLAGLPFYFIPEERPPAPVEARREPIPVGSGAGHAN